LLLLLNSAGRRFLFFGLTGSAIGVGGCVGSASTAASTAWLPSPAPEVAVVVVAAVGGTVIVVNSVEAVTKPSSERLKMLPRLHLG